MFGENGRTCFNPATLREATPLGRRLPCLLQRPVLIIFHFDFNFKTLAGETGFEPVSPLGPPVFETGAFSRSAIHPNMQIKLVPKARFELARQKHKFLRLTCLPFHHLGNFEKIGSESGNRTRDLRIMSPSL